MALDFAGGNRRVQSSEAGVRNFLAILIFVCMIFPAAFATGAGKSNIPCHGTVISPTDDIVSIINGGAKNQTFCIEGEHRITSMIQLRTGQSLIGTTPNSRISGAVVLSPWHATSTQGVYYYDGPHAATQPHLQNHFAKSGGNVCYRVTTYQDDLFFRTNPGNDRRIMRVLSAAEVDPSHAITTKGQAVTGGEAGRFFFDYANQRIYLSLPHDLNPNTATVDLSLRLKGYSDALLFGAGQENVTLQNLTLEKAMTYGVYSGVAWTLKDMTIRFIHNIGAYNVSGGSTGHPTIIDDTLFTNNGRAAINAAFTTNVTITNSEMSWNNIANFQESAGQTGSGVCQGYHDAGAFHIYNDNGTEKQPSIIIDHLWSHHNIGDGLWSDGGTQYIQITNSIFNGNERYGYLHESSCQILFSNNTVHHNGKPLKNPGITGGGVNVSDSNYGTFSSNLLYDNYAGFAFHLTFQKRHHKMDINQCLGGKSDDDTSNSLKHNHVVNNTIYTCEGDVSIGKLYGKGGSLNSRGNRFQSNHYHLADSTSNWFADADSAGKVEPLDWNSWQRGNHDTQGTLKAGCTYHK